MSSKGNESTPIINKIYGGRGGDGGRAGEGGVGGHGGTGEGPTFNYSRVENVTNNINSSTSHGHGLEEVLSKWLGSPPDMKDRQHELRKLHHGATGRWLLDDVQFINWKATPSSLWIKGIWLQLVLEKAY
ncbi:hypothetical protein MVEN_01990400 [Mycena venus]|uniref:Uncharacterized protein n=1 Tax=Mycena venus TaxID=2733690 RepID=A0A8H6XDJ7_9AGAR|nr:hypothetical protein MVEN_01990400 [Mycena venus]